MPRAGAHLQHIGRERPAFDVVDNGPIGMLSRDPDAIADAAAAKASSAPKGCKRDRERVAKKARLVALALNVRAMRISLKGDAHE